MKKTLKSIQDWNYSYELALRSRGDYLDTHDRPRSVDWNLAKYLRDQGNDPQSAARDCHSPFLPPPAPRS